jgi:hypothetical protein
MARQHVVLVSALFLLGCSGDGTTIGDAAGAGDGDDPSADGGDGSDIPKDPALATGISISQIAIFQTVKSQRMLDGMAKSSNVPIIADKAALMRVYFKLDAGWTPHNVMALLDISANGQMQTLKSTFTPSADSTDDALPSTVNFDLALDLVTTDATYAVRLVDPMMSATPTSDPAPQRWPLDGSQTLLGAQSNGAQLKIVLVPIRYNADGSGRLPDTSQAQLDRYKNFMYSLYPTPVIDMTVHAPVNFSSTISPGGQGWGSLMQFVANLHQSEGATDQYYYAVFEPASSYQAFCGGGCVAGLSLLAQQPTDVWARVSMGLGYTGDEATTIMGQEVGHAHGRGHAPCGTNQGLDPSYPYTDGRIGVWGYSLIDKTLIGPTQAKDVMSYCSPQWISDYNYKALYLRIKFVNNASIVPGPKKTYRWANVEGNVLVSYGPPFTADFPPGGTPRTINGVAGYYYPYDHVDGGLLLVP